MILDRAACYQALKSRDSRFDGRFFTGVRTTRIFCRPICPARTPKSDHCQYFSSAAAALDAGFRPCLRCRPEVAPGTPAWNGTSNTVIRAMRLIAEGALDEGDVNAVAARLGVGERHLRRLFVEQVGASPVTVAQTRRLLFAKQLVTETGLPLTDVAFASGYGSLRRFHDAFHRFYACAPRELRRRASEDSGKVALRLAYRPPYDWSWLLEFLAPRAIPGVETVAGGVYRRTIQVGSALGRVTVRPDADAPALIAEIECDDIRFLRETCERLRRLFDLDADPAVITTHLAGLRPAPGLRLPGAWDSFELCVRAILGQQISVAAATTLAGRIVEQFGTRLAFPDPPNRLFPTAAVLAQARLRSIGLTEPREEAVTALSRAVAGGRLQLDRMQTLEQTVRELTEIPGIGPWTAHYIAMRACAFTDAFPASDLGLRKAASKTGDPVAPRALELMSQVWRPWRAYAAMALWRKPV